MKDPTVAYFKDPTIYVWGVVERADTILFVRKENQRKHLIWSLPGGKVKAGDSLSNAVVSHIEAQTNLQTAPKEELTQSELAGHDHIFLVDYIEGTIKPGGGITAVQWVDVSQIVNLKLPKIQNEAIEANF